MKYITEADLRNLYRTTPFTTYETEPGTRLTPGARQFLGDRGIRIPDEILPQSGSGTVEPEERSRCTSGDRRKIRRGMIRTVLVQMQKKTQQRRTAGKVRSDVRRI